MGKRAAALLSETIGYLYEAPLDAAAWPLFIGACSRAIGAHAGHLLIWDEANRRPTFSAVSENFSPDVDRDYQRYYGAIDPRLKLAFSLPPQQWMLCHRHFNTQFVASSEIYNDYLRPLGVRYGAHLRTPAFGGLSTLLAFFRGPDDQPFDDATRTLHSLTRHIDRAGRLSIQMQRLKLMASITSDALDTINYPVFVVDPTGKVRFFNRAAHSFIKTDSTLNVIAQRLNTGNVKLKQILYELVALAAVEVGGRGGSLGIPRARDGKCYQLLVLPLAQQAVLAGLWQTPLAMVVIVSPDTDGPLSVDAIRSLFGLTPAESRLAHELAEGKSLEELANEQMITIATARCHLQRIFAKTGTSRQAELVRILRMAPRLGGH